MKFLSIILSLSIISLRFSHYGCSESFDEGSGDSSTVLYDYIEGTTEVSTPEDQNDEDGIRSEPCACGKAGKPTPPIINFQGKARFEEATPLVIGGGEAGEDEFPWMAAISKKRLWDANKPKIICGGTLINSRYVLTAAHCIKNQFSSQLEILFRAHNISNIKSDPKVIKIKPRRLIPHPKWDEATVANDIGLIELSTPVLFSESTGLNPACLPTKKDGDFAGKIGTVVGFGYTRPSGFMATILQKLNVPIISHEECSKTKYGDTVASNPSFLCAGYDEGGKDACTNDSGGPLTVIKDGKHTVVGIVSWGHGCAQPKLPGVYTRITKYLEWISSIVKTSSSSRCSIK